MFKRKSVVILRWKVLMKTGRFSLKDDKIKIKSTNQKVRSNHGRKLKKYQSDWYKPTRINRVLALFIWLIVLRYDNPIYKCTLRYKVTPTHHVEVGRDIDKPKIIRQSIVLCGVGELMADRLVTHDCLILRV